VVLDLSLKKHGQQGLEVQKEGDRVENGRIRPGMAQLAA